MHDSTQGRDPLERLEEDFIARLRRGEQPTIAEYEAQLPDRATEVRQHLSLIALIERHKPAIGEPGETTATIDPAEVLALLEPSTTPGSLGKLDHYEVLRLLGRGGFGTVVKAFDQTLQRLVAIKLLNPELAATSPPRKRFLREAVSAAAVKHENVVQVYSVEEKPFPYLVMEFVEGRTLQQRMDEAGPLELPELLHLARQIAAGLAAAHDSGLIHRDIKPSNILLERGALARVKITDFGLARTVDAASITQSGVALGTPLYMSPEQTAGSKVDHRSDLFSFGSLLYAMAAGHAPFRAPTMVAVLRRVAEDTPRPLQDIIPELPDRLVALINTLLAKNPDDRCQTAREVYERLDAIQRDLQAGKLVTRASSPQPVADTPTSGPPARRRTRRTVWIGVAMLLLLLAGVAVLEATHVTHVTGLFDHGTERVSSTGSADDATPGHEGNPATLPPPTADSERALARWVLSQPNRRLLVYPTEGAGLVQIDHPENLPKGPFEVHGIYLYESFKLSDQDLALVGMANALRVLALGTFGRPAADVTAAQVTDQGMAALFSPSVCRSLSTLSCFALFPKVSDQGYRRALDRASALQGLQLTLPPGKGGFVSSLSLPRLENFELLGGEGATSGVFEGLSSRMPELTSLTVGGQGQTERDLGELSRLDLLRRLALTGAGITDASLSSIIKLSKLRSLDLSGNPLVTDKGGERLSTMTALEELNLQGTGVGERTCAAMASLPALKTLNLGLTRVKDAGIATLSSSKSLRSLDLIGCKRITDASLGALAACRLLRNLRLSVNAQLTEAAVRSLGEALPGCNIESDYVGLKSDSDRLAARWVLSLGTWRSVTIRHDGREEVFQSVDALPKGAFELTGVKLALADPSGVTDDDLARFAGCRHIRELHIDNLFHVTDVGLANFAGSASGLESLTLHNLPGVTDAGLTSFHPGPGLWRLSLQGLGVSDAGVAPFGRCVNLAELELFVLPGVTDAALAAFRGCKALTLLTLQVAETFSDTGLSNFAGCERLKFLLLSGSKRVTDAGLAHFRDCKELEILQLNYLNKVTDAGLAYFSDCPRLSRLGLRETTDVTDAGLAVFGGCKNLQEVSLVCLAKLTDAGLAQFDDVKGLRKLDLNGSPLVTDGGLAHFRACKDLEVLDLDRMPRITEAGLAALGDCRKLYQLRVCLMPAIGDAGIAHFGQCRQMAILQLDHTSVSDACLPVLADFPSLQQLSLLGSRVSRHGYEQLRAVYPAPNFALAWSEPNRGVAEAALALGGAVEVATPEETDARPVTTAADLPAGFFQVRRLSLAGATKPLGKIVDLLPRLSSDRFDRLEDLDLSRIAGFDYALLVPVHGLRALSVADTGLDDNLLASFPKLSTLERLVLDGNRISGRGLPALNNQPALVDLSLARTLVNELTLRYLAELPRLKRLSLAGTALTDAAARGLASLNHLQWLDVSQTKLTPDSIAALKKSLPECSIQATVK
jgi:serine/threonine protein kinase/Leucine-rich repeat (LRR) protein